MGLWWWSLIRRICCLIRKFPSQKAMKVVVKKLFVFLEQNKFHLKWFLETFLDTHVLKETYFLSSALVYF